MVNNQTVSMPTKQAPLNVEITQGGMDLSKTSSSQPLQKLSGIKALLTLANPVRGVLLDQFGVLHDGQQPYPGARDAVEQLYLNNIKVVIVSNSASAPSSTQTRLAGMGFKPEWFHAIITSGTLLPAALNEFIGTHQDKQGEIPVIHAGMNKPEALTQNLHPRLRATVSEEKAQLTLLQGTEAYVDDSQNLVSTDDKIPPLLSLIVPAAHKGLPAICVNPDEICTIGNTLYEMPGTLANSYAQAAESVGKRVSITYLGKPYAPIYTQALSVMKEAGIEPNDVVGIGDSPAHDVKGAVNAGIRALLILGGIHAKQLALPTDAPQRAQISSENLPNISSDEVSKLCKAHGAPNPDYYVPFFES